MSQATSPFSKMEASCTARIFSKASACRKPKKCQGDLEGKMRQ